MIAPVGVLRRPAHALRSRLEAASEGRARMQVVLVLACVLGLDSADVGSIGSIAGQLETALRIDNTELGIIVALPSLMTALATIPLGLLADRVDRVRLVTVGVIFWSIAEAASGAATGWVMLLLIRMAVGAGIAAAGPPVTSLIGDFFPAQGRARAWGLILGGELLGAGFGFLIAGEAATASWRWAFVALAVPGSVVAWTLHRWLPEPARGGASWLHPGAEEVLGAEEALARVGAVGAAAPDEFEESEVQEAIEEEHVPPDQGLVLHDDPARMGLWQAMGYVLRVRTNLILFVASALGYFYLTGLETFAVVFFQGRYGLTHATATLLVVAVGLGAIAGVVASGAIADRLVARGVLKARIWVAGVSFLAAALLFLPGLVLHAVGIALVFYVLAGIVFGARNAPADAARLDVLHHRLWGRAEAARTLLRRVLTAIAPITFGALADALAPGSAVHGATGFGASASAQGLYLTFLSFLVIVAAGGGLTLWALRTYERDVATAVASEEATTLPPPTP